MNAGTVTLVVRHGWAVYRDGRHRTGGEPVEVDEDIARLWLARGWADEPPEAPNTRRGQTSARASTARHDASADSDATTVGLGGGAA